MQIDQRETERYPKESYCGSLAGTMLPLGSIAVLVRAATQTTAFHPLLTTDNEHPSTLGYIAGV